jgi:hypothetical protein
LNKFLFARDHHDKDAIRLVESFLIRTRFIIIVVAHLLPEFRNFIHIKVGCWHQTHSTGADALDLFEHEFTLFIQLVFTGVAVVWALTHFYNVGLPVNLRVVFTKPSQTKDDILLANTGHCEGHLFRVLTKV